MSVTRAELTDFLSTCDPADLAELLEFAGVRVPGTPSAETLARQVCQALWWRSHSPAGLGLRPATLDGIVDAVEARLKLDPPLQGDCWTRVRQLADRHIPGSALPEADQLDPDLQARLSRRPGAAIPGVLAAGSSAGARLAALQILRWSRTPIGRLLPLLPRIGPIFGAIRGGAGVVAGWAGPIGVALALASLNRTMGPEYDKALPLLLGIGLLVRTAPERALALPLRAGVPEPEAAHAG